MDFALSAINLKGSLFLHVWNARWAGFQASGEHTLVNEHREVCLIHLGYMGFVWYCLLDFY